MEFPIRKDSKDGYRNSCKNCEYKKTKKWKLENISKTIEYYKKYSVKNKESLNRYKNDWFNERMKIDNLFKLKRKIKTTIKDSFRFKKFSKNEKVIDILGCSFEEFKVHLESKFESWMSWNNHGLYNGDFNYGWDIDHIIPISSARTKEDVIKLNHYTNLQPLCSKINRDIKKSNINYESM